LARGRRRIHAGNGGGTRGQSCGGVEHFIWSTLPDVEAISGGQFDVPHFTGKAKVDRVVTEAGFANHTFVIAPFFYQNLAGAMAPQQQADGSMGWALPLDPSVRCIHMGDIRELGEIVAGAFVHPDQAAFLELFSWRRLIAPSAPSGGPPRRASWQPTPVRQSTPPCGQGRERRLETHLRRRGSC
jgi:hypothetical protein